MRSGHDRYGRSITFTAPSSFFWKSLTHPQRDLLVEQRQHCACGTPSGVA